MKEKNKPFYVDEIELSSHGPIYSDVYRRFKSYGGEPIRQAAYIGEIENESDFYLFLGLITPLAKEEIEIRDDDTKLIKHVVECLSTVSALELSERIRKELQWYELEDEKSDVKSTTYDKNRLIAKFDEKIKNFNNV